MFRRVRIDGVDIIELLCFTVIVLVISWKPSVSNAYSLVVEPVGTFSWFSPTGRGIV